MHMSSLIYVFRCDFAATGSDERHLLSEAIKAYVKENRKPDEQWQHMQQRLGKAAVTAFATGLAQQWVPPEQLKSSDASMKGMAQPGCTSPCLLYTCLSDIPCIACEVISSGSVVCQLDSISIMLGRACTALQVLRAEA